MLKFRGKGHRRYGSLNSEDLLDTAAADEFDVSSHVDPSGPVSSAHVVDSAAIATPPKHRRRNTLVRKLVGGGRGNRKSGHKTQRGCRVEFGVALDDVVNKHVVDDAADPSVTGVPYVVASCTQYIEEHGTFAGPRYACLLARWRICAPPPPPPLPPSRRSWRWLFAALSLGEGAGLDHEGLYRLSGQKSLVENLKAEFDKGGKVILNELHGEALEQDINIVAGALKLYLRELPTCVLSDDGNSTLDAALADGSLTPDRAVEVLGSETAPSRRLLQWLLLHLRLVATHSEANKMPAKNLLLLFSPTLRVSAEVLLFLLDNVDRCFGNTPPASPSPTPFGEEASAAAATEAIAKGFGDDTPWCPDAAEPTAEACGSEPTAASPELSSGYESVVDASSEGPVLPVDPPQPAATLPHALPQGPSPPPMPAAVSALSSTRSRALLPQLSVDNFVPVSEAKRVRAEMEMINHELSLHHTAMQQYAARDDTYPSNKMEEMWVSVAMSMRTQRHGLC